MKFQFCSLLNQAWFKAIIPATNISGFRKWVCPFNATAIQPYSEALSDENSCSSSNEASGNEVISYQSLTEKDTEFVVNENSSSQNILSLKRIFVSFKTGLKMVMTCIMTICTLIG